MYKKFRLICDCKYGVLFTIATLVDIVYYLFDLIEFLK